MVCSHYKEMGLVGECASFQMGRDCRGWGVFLTLQESMETKVVKLWFLIWGVHGGIPKVNGPGELYENMLKVPIPPMDFALDVVFIPSILVGIKHVGSEFSTGNSRL